MALTDEQTADAIAAAADPLFATIREIAVEAGLTQSQASAVVHRMRARGLLLGRALGDITREETKRLYEYRANEILLSITTKDIEQASLYQKMTSAAIATDKALLLDGQPTQILSIQQLDNLDKLAANLLHEIERRGFSARMIEQPDGPEPRELEAGGAVVETLPGLDGTGRPGQFKDPARRFQRKRQSEDPTPSTQLP